MGKDLESVIAKRISYAAETYNLLPRTHLGGRKATGAEHAIHFTVEKILDAWNFSYQQVTSLLLLDVSGAFDNVSHARLLHNLQKRRIDPKVVSWIESFLKTRSTTLSFGDTNTDLLEISTGIPQESSLSPILYLFYNADLMDACNDPTINATSTGYIDDVNILVHS